MVKFSVQQVLSRVFNYEDSHVKIESIHFPTCSLEADWQIFYHEGIPWLSNFWFPKTEWLLTFVAQEPDDRNHHVAFPCFAGHLLLLVQNLQTYKYVWRGSLNLNCSLDVFFHLHKVTMETSQMTVGTISLYVVLSWGNGSVSTAPWRI